MAESKILRSLDGYDSASFANSKHANISQAERAFYKRIGRIVVVDLSFTVNTAITGKTEILFSGLPKCSGTETRFRVPPTYGSNQPLRLGITNNGYIMNQYTNGGIQPGVYEASITYICQ